MRQGEDKGKTRGREVGETRGRQGGEKERGGENR